MSEIKKGLNYARQDLKNIQEAKNLSPVEKVSIFLLTLAYICTIEAWVKMWNGIHLYYHETMSEGIKYRYRRDWYDGIWLFFSILLLLTSSLLFNKIPGIWIIPFFIILPLYRLFDIIQKNAHIVLFNQPTVINILESKRAVDLGKLMSINRRIVLSLMNFLEISILYACIYIHTPFANNYHPSLEDAIYFSIVTITTLGYGDITPIEISKWCASSEALIGILFLILVISSLVQILKPPDDLR